MKPWNPATEPRQAAGDAQVSPEAEPGASGPDLRPRRNPVTRWQEAALLVAFRRLGARERVGLLRRARLQRIASR